MADCGKESKKKGVLSLADLLAKSSSSGTRTRSKSQKTSLEDLKKQLNGNQGTSSNLNMSKALNIGVEKMKLVDISQIKQEDPKRTGLPAGLFNQINLTNQNALGKVNRLKGMKCENQNAKEEHGTDAVNRTHREYQQMIVKAEREKLLNFDVVDYDEEPKTRAANFNLLRLPKGLNLEKGRLNVYKSGIIEVLTNDSEPKVYRFKPTVFQADTNPTTLIIATDSQAYLDSFEVYETASLSQK